MKGNMNTSTVQSVNIGIRAIVCAATALLVAGCLAAATAAEPAELPAREWPEVADGFASVDAMGQNGTTGGAGGGINPPRYQEINRQPDVVELEAAYDAAREAGLWRFDKRLG